MPLREESAEVLRRYSAGGPASSRSGRWTPPPLLAGLLAAVLVLPACATPLSHSSAVSVPRGGGTTVEHQSSQSRVGPAVTSPSRSTVRTVTKPAKKSAKAKVNCRKKKCIALTFDDGPGPYTKRLLRTLNRKQVQATFFMLGMQVRAYPKVARAVARAGHSIGVHTWDHRSLPTLSNARIAWEIRSTARIIRKVTGTKPDLLRPPYGATSRRVTVAARRAGLGLAFWNVDTLDWKYRNSARVTASAVRDTRRGSIILVHDIHRTTVAAVPGIIDRLRRRGYTFVTVEQLVGKPKPGHKYYRG